MLGCLKRCECCRLRDLVQEVSACPPYVPVAAALPAVVGPPGSSMVAMARASDGYRAPLVARAHLRLGLWTWQLNVSTPSFLPEVINSLNILLLSHSVC